MSVAFATSGSFSSAILIIIACGVSTLCVDTARAATLAPTLSYLNRQVTDNNEAARQDAASKYRLNDADATIAPIGRPRARQLAEVIANAARANGVNVQELVRQVRLEQMFDALGSSYPLVMVTPSSKPLHRNARTNVVSTHSRHNAQQQRQQLDGANTESDASNEIDSLKHALSDPTLSASAAAERATLMGLVWQAMQEGRLKPEELTAAADASAPADALAWLKFGPSQRARHPPPINGERVPNMLESSLIDENSASRDNWARSDYDWKRVENSRWNNLRGMWGKRSVSPAEGPDSDDNNTAAKH